MGQSCMIRILKFTGPSSSSLYLTFKPWPTLNAAIASFLLISGAYQPTPPTNSLHRRLLSWLPLLARVTKQRRKWWPPRRRKDFNPSRCTVPALLPRSHLRRVSFWRLSSPPSISHVHSKSAIRIPAASSGTILLTGDHEDCGRLPFFFPSPVSFFPRFA